MSKNNKSCVVCGHGLDENEDISVLKIRKSVFIKLTPCYICPVCDSFFNSDHTLVDFINNQDIQALFHRCMRLTRLVALNAPEVIIANELRVAIKKAVETKPSSFFDSLKEMFFDGESTHPTFTESQTVDLITAAEMSLKKKKKKKKKK